jgi:hypothetical protein
MRAYYNNFKIDGKPILTPDEDVVLEYYDLDSEETGRDESGVMHRIILRKDVKKWNIPYGALTLEEYQYMESLFAGKSTFTVSYSDPEYGTCIAYRSQRAFTIRNSRTGDLRGYSLSIIEC